MRQDISRSEDWSCVLGHKLLLRLDLELELELPLELELELELELKLELELEKKLEPELKLEMELLLKDCSAPKFCKKKIATSRREGLKTCILQMFSLS